MRKLLIATLALLAVSALAVPGFTQQPPATPPVAGAAPTGGGCSMMSGMHGGGMMQQGGMMGGSSMTGMMGGPSDSPRMMQMRGEMMRAMGDILTKYGKMMESSSR